MSHQCWQHYKLNLYHIRHVAIYMYNTWKMLKVALNTIYCSITSSHIAKTCHLLTHVCRMFGNETSQYHVLSSGLALLGSNKHMVDVRLKLCM